MTAKKQKGRNHLILFPQPVQEKHKAFPPSPNKNVHSGLLHKAPNPAWYLCAVTLTWEATQVGEDWEGGSNPAQSLLAVCSLDVSFHTSTVPASLGCCID